MGTFDVYRMGNISTGNLLAIQPKEDIFSCEFVAIGRVHVSAASFREQYRGPGFLSKPYMEILGEVYSVFIEDDDPTYFPCGSKDLHLKDIQHPNGDGTIPDDPQEVKIRYILNFDEMGQISEMGLYADANDFTVPTNLVGNTIEIPMTIRYIGVYETPIAVVEVLYPEELETDTQTNGYYGIFNACQPSSEVALSKDEGWQWSEKKHLKEDEVVYGEEEYQPEAEPEEEEVLTAEDFEDNASYDAVNELFKEHAAQTAHLREKAKADMSAISTINALVNDKLEREAREATNNRENSISDAIFGVAGEDTRVVERRKATYDDFREAAQKYEAEAAKCNDEVTDKARKNDAVYDNLTFNSGSDDIAGYGMNNQSSSSDSGEQYLGDYLDNPLFAAVDGANMSEEDKEKAKERSGQKSIERARQQDNIADNMAINEAYREGVEVDTAGYGANLKKKEQENNAKANFAAGLLGDIMSNPAPQPVVQEEGQYL